MARSFDIIRHNYLIALEMFSGRNLIPDDGCWSKLRPKRRINADNGQFLQESNNVKVRVVAAQFPPYVFRLVQWDRKTGWEIRIYQPYSELSFYERVDNRRRRDLSTGIHGKNELSLCCWIPN